jgi:hypothetical protein
MKKHMFSKDYIDHLRLTGIKIGANIVFYSASNTPTRRSPVNSVTCGLEIIKTDMSLLT